MHRVGMKFCWRLYSPITGKETPTGRVDVRVRQSVTQSVSSQLSFVLFSFPLVNVIFRQSVKFFVSKFVLSVNWILSVSCLILSVNSSVFVHLVVWSQLSIVSCGCRVWDCCPKSVRSCLFIGKSCPLLVIVGNVSSVHVLFVIFVIVMLSACQLM